MAINIITVDGNILNSISAYNISDVGAKVNRMKAVGTDTVFFNDKGYRDGFKEIRVEGMDMNTIVDSINTLYLAGDPIDLIDLYGTTYNGVITNFNSVYIKTKDAYSYSFDFIVFPAGAVDNYLFRVGGTLVNIVESCSVSDSRGNNYTELNMADGKIGYQVDTYTSHLFDINISGIELVTDGIGDFTSTLVNGSLINITLPNGREFQGLLVSKNNTLLEGSSNFQNYSVSFIAGAYIGVTPPAITIIDNANGITSEESLEVLYERYSIRVAAERYTKHITFQGIVIQSFPPDANDKEISIIYLIHKDAIDPAPSGAIVDITIGSNVFHGIVTGRTEDPLERCVNVKRVNFTLVSIPPESP